MGVKIDFTTKYGVDGEYVNFDPQISNKTRVNLKMKYWKNKDTRDTEEAIPFNDQMAGGSDERITGFKCSYQFDLDLDSPLNIFQQGYAYLHTLEEFTDSVDDVTGDQSTQLEAVKSINIATLKREIQ